MIVLSKFGQAAARKLHYWTEGLRRLRQVLIIKVGVKGVEEGRKERKKEGREEGR